MHCTLTVENLTRAVGLVAPLAGKQVHLPVLHNISIVANEAGIKFTSTNLEISIETIARGKVETPGSFTVPAKTLLEMTRFLKGDTATLRLDGSELEIKAGKTKTKLKGIPSEEFPVVPEVSKESVYEIETSVFLEALGVVVGSAAKNEMRLELSGVYFGFFTERHRGLTLAATDSYRLSEKLITVKSGENPNTLIVPARTIQEILRLLSGEDKNSTLEISIGGGQIAVFAKDFTMISRLIDGNYPDYAQIIPEKFASVIKIDRTGLLNSVRAASLFCEDSVSGVEFSFKKDSVTVRAANNLNGEFEEEVSSDLSGEENQITLNYKYLLDGLSSLDGEVTVNLNSKDSPCLIRKDGQEDFLYIIMPIRQ